MTKEKRVSFGINSLKLISNFSELEFEKKYQKLIDSFCEKK